MYPSFLNDKKAEKERIRSRETSASKASHILTPSKIINELLDRYDSVKKSSCKKQEKIVESTPEKENEPMEEYWKVMEKNTHEEAVKEKKEDYIKGLFQKREELLQK